MLESGLGARLGRPAGASGADSQGLIFVNIYIYIYIYIHVYIHIYVCMYVCMYRERQRCLFATGCICSHPG